VVVRGQNAPAPPTGVVDVVVNNASNNLCIDGGIGDSRLWFQNAGGWFGFYDAAGVPQDMISWGTPTPSDLNGNPCIPPTNSLPTGVTQLDSYNASGIGVNLGASSVGMTYVRIPDGGAWSTTMSTENFSYGECNDPLNCLAETGVTVCNGSATATVTAGTAPYTYTWDDPAAQTSASASGLCPGTYQLTLSDAAGCTQTYSAVITDDVFTIDAAIQDPSCANNDGSIAVTADPASSLYTYVWTANTGITDSTTTNATGLGEGTYSVSVTAGACVRDTTVTLTAPAAIDSVAASVSPTLCGQADGSILVGQVFGGTAPYSYVFNGSGPTSETSYTGLAAGTYSIQVTDDQGCAYTLNGLIVDPSAGITSIDVDQVLPDCGKSNGELSVITVVGGSAPYSYILNGTQLDSSSVSGLAGNTYILQVQDVNGCSYNETIILGEDGKSFVNIPNVFTPNGDNNNDEWFVSTGCVQKLRVVILNRWGNVVHEYEDVNGVWDGLTNGDKVSQGVYFYKAEIEFTSGQKQTEHGNITVIY
jgi:gliding motility-associated-like protein